MLLGRKGRGKERKEGRNGEMVVRIRGKGNGMQGS